MYLPPMLPDARVLVTVKAYPLPSNKYEELVCTAGVLPDGRWIRIYPVPFKRLPYAQRYRKFEWVRLNLIKNSKDFRPESYRPLRNLDEPITVERRIPATPHGWEERRRYALREVFFSMEEIIRLAKGPEKRSLAVLKPREILDLAVEPDAREWKQSWLDYFRLQNLFELNEQGEATRRVPIRKLPYKYFYTFLSEGDRRPRRLMIEDWELGALYWRCLRDSGGDEQEANRKVRQKYLGEFRDRRDLYLFLSTTLRFHNCSPNPFIIVGVFYPPASRTPMAAGLQQLSLFQT